MEVEVDGFVQLVSQRMLTKLKVTTEESPKKVFEFCDFDRVHVKEAITQKVFIFLLKI